MHPAITHFYSTKSRRSALVFCLANAAFFSALFLTYFYLKANTSDWPTPFHFASLLMTGAMTMFSVCGSFTAALSAYTSDAGDREAPVRWMAIAVACWAVFLFLEIVEWIRLVFIIHLGPHTPFGQIFLVMTGCHFLCIFFCLLWMSVTAIDIRKRDPVAVSIYSHFLNFVWIVMLLVLYYGNADLGGIG